MAKKRNVARSEAVLQRSLAALLEMAEDISGTLDLDEVLDRVQRRTAALLPCDRVFTYYWDADRNAFREIARYGLPEELASAAAALEFQPGQPIVDQLTAGQIGLINDVTDQQLMPIEILTYFGIRAMLTVPLVVRGRILGALVVVSTQDGRGFDAEQVRLLQSIARHVGVAIETTDLYRAQREEAQIAAALARVGREMISSLATPVLLDRLCQLTTEVLHCDCSHTLLWKPDEEVYVPVSGYGQAPEQWEAMRVIKAPRTAVRELIERLGREECVQVVFAGVENRPVDCLAEQHHFTANLYVALRRGADIIGYHAARYRHRNERFTSQQERIMRGIGQLASMALENARLVEELERASRLKSDFVATMSHELRTPLNVIVGYNDLLLDGAFGPLSEQQTDSLRRVDKSARELNELISATLDVSRLETGRVPLQLRELCVSDLIAEIDAETTELRDKPGVRFAWHLPAELPCLYTDPVKLKVVLKNLIANAVKFTEQGSVTVGVRRSDGKIEFSVTDTGVGITPDAQTFIFEPFRQADSSTTRRYGGVGLGLYITRRLLDMLGGGITVDSEIQRGSTFRVWLPLQITQP